MPRLDPRLVVHTFNVDPKAKPVAQPARVFHTKIEGQIVKEVMALSNPSNTRDGCLTLYQ